MPDPEPFSGAFPFLRRRTPLAWRVEIPGWHPTPLNRLLDNKWTRARLKKADAKAVDKACGLAGVPRVRLSRKEKALRKELGIVGRQPGDPEPIKRRVRLEITLEKGQRACDQDAYLKSTLDALKNCGALFEDNPTWCEPVLPIPFDRAAEKKTVIILEDLA